jgi:hypothetical protein
MVIIWLRLLKLETTNIHQVPYEIKQPIDIQPSARDQSDLILSGTERLLDLLEKHQVSSILDARVQPLVKAALVLQLRLLDFQVS